MLEARGFEVCAAVDNPVDLLAAISEQRPDIAVINVRLPPTFTDESLRAALDARRPVPGLPVLVLPPRLCLNDKSPRQLMRHGTASRRSRT